MGEIDPCTFGGVLADPSKLAWMQNAFLCSIKLQVVGNHLLKELAHHVKKNNGPKGLWNIIGQFPRFGDNYSLGLLQLLGPDPSPKASIGDPEEEGSDLLARQTSTASGGITHCPATGGL